MQSAPTRSQFFRLYANKIIFSLIVSFLTVAFFNANTRLEKLRIARCGDALFRKSLGLNLLILMIFREYLAAS